MSKKGKKRKVIFIEEISVFDYNCYEYRCVCFEGTSVRHQ